MRGRNSLPRAAFDRFLIGSLENGLMTKTTRLLDVLSFLFSFGLIGTAGIWLTRSGILSVSIAQSDNPTWYMIRSTGITAYALCTLSVLWGLALSTRIVKDWCPGALSMVLHSALSWFGVLFGLIHAILLMLDSYFAYTLRDIFVPFVGPYRPEAVGLGTLAFWILLVIALSFPFMKLMGNRNWRLLHLGSYIAFTLTTLHAWLAGTDSSSLGLRVMLAVSAMLVIGFTLLRVRTAFSGKPQAAKASRARLAR